MRDKESERGNIRKHGKKEWEKENGNRTKKREKETQQDRDEREICHWAVTNPEYTQTGPLDAQRMKQ